MKNTWIRLSKGLYNCLLRLYPRSYRQEFGQEMQFVFSEQLADSYRRSGDYGVFSLWVRTSFDAGKSLITQHLENQQGGTSMKNSILQNSIVRAGLGTAALLMIPLVGMQLSDGWNWTLSDFLIMGTMLFVTGLSIDLLLKTKNKYRLLAAAGIVLMFLWLWVELAVGLFTNWGS